MPTLFRILALAAALWFHPSIAAEIARAEAVGGDVSDGVLSCESIAGGRSRAFVGANVNAVFWEGMYTDPEMIRAVQSLSRPTLRWPGGTESDYWDWLSGRPVGSCKFGSCRTWDGKILQEPELYKRFSSFSEGTPANWAVLARETRAETLLVANMVTNSSEGVVEDIALAMASDISPIGIELGNEQYFGRAEGTDNNAIAFPTAESHVDAAGELAGMLRARWPSLPLAQPAFVPRVDVATGAISQGHDERMLTWNERIIAAGSSTYADAFALHFYPVFPARGQSTRDDYLRRVGAFADDYWRLLTQTPQWLALPQDREIWITELNASFPQAGEMSGTWAHGLFMGSFTLNAMEDRRTRMVIAHMLTGNTTWQSVVHPGGTPAIPAATASGSYQLTPSGIAIASIGSIANELECGRTVSASAFNSPAGATKPRAWLGFGERGQGLVVVNPSPTPSSLSLAAVGWVDAIGIVKTADPMLRVTSENGVQESAIDSTGTVINVPPHSIMELAPKSPIAQSIDFPAPGGQVVGGSLQLSASASSGRSVHFSTSTASICAVTQGFASFLSAGMCEITASQAGGGGFGAAIPVSRQFPVVPRVPSPPVIRAVLAGSGEALIGFEEPEFDGGAQILEYIASAHPGAIASSGQESPIRMQGLQPGTEYRFVVQARNGVGLSAASQPVSVVLPAGGAGDRPLIAVDDREVVAENSGKIRIDVLRNDGIHPSLARAFSLSIVSPPSMGAVTTAMGTHEMLEFQPAADVAGTDRFRYRACAHSACAEADVTIVIRPVPGNPFVIDGVGQAGFVDIPVSGMRSVDSVRFDAFGLSVPTDYIAAVDTPSLSTAQWGTGFTHINRRSIPSSATSAEWRVFTEISVSQGADVTVFLGLDENGNGEPDPMEMRCASTTRSGRGACDLAVSAPAGSATDYWILVHARAHATNADVSVSETLVSGGLRSTGVAASGPGSIARPSSFPIRLSWEDHALALDRSRIAWVRVAHTSGTPLGWFPVRISRREQRPAPLAMPNAQWTDMLIPPAGSHDRMFIDVPLGASSLSVRLRGGTPSTFSLVRAAFPEPSSRRPIIEDAPSSAVPDAVSTLVGGEAVAEVLAPAAGRWYVRPRNESGAEVKVSVKADLASAGQFAPRGGFFNPARPGSGVFLSSAGTEIAGLWYTFLQDGSPTWYYLQATSTGLTDSWSSPVYRSAWNGASNFLVPVGRLTATESDGGNISLAYTLDGETGAETFTPFGGGCPSFDGVRIRASGHWFDPQTSGSGYTVQLFDNYEFFLTFAYDERGVPRYLVAERSGFNGAVSTLNMQQLSGSCPMCDFQQAPTRRDVGRLTRFIGASGLEEVHAEVAFADGVTGTWTARDRVVPLGLLQGCP